MKYVKIKYVAEVVSGSTPKTNIDEYWNGEYNWITPKEINENSKYIFNTERRITKEGAESCSLRELKKNTVLLTSRAPIGKVALVGKNMYCNQGFKNLVCNEQVINPEYMYYWLKSQNQYLNSLGRGATFKEISKKIVENIEIPIQDIETQNKIVEVLDKSQDLIDKKIEQIDLLDELVKSRFIEMFGNIYINDKNWNKCILSDYCEVKGGKRVPKGEKLLDEKTEYPYLRVSDLKNGTVIEEDIKYISNEVYEKIKRYTISSNDVYLTNVGTVGIAGTIPNKFNNANLTENAVKLVFDNNLINKTYLSHYLNSDVCQNYILERKMTVGVPKLAIFRIESLPLILPPIELQNEFAEFVEKIDSIKAAAEKSLEQLNDNFNSLMQKAFKGELF